MSITIELPEHEENLLNQMRDQFNFSEETVNGMIIDQIRNFAEKMTGYVRLEIDVPAAEETGDDNNVPSIRLVKNAWEFTSTNDRDWVIDNLAKSAGRYRHIANALIANSPDIQASNVVHKLRWTSGLLKEYKKVIAADEVNDNFIKYARAPSVRHPDEVKDEWVDLYINQGVSFSNIARKYSAHTDTVRRAVADRTSDMDPPPEPEKQHEPEAPPDVFPGFVIK